MIGEQLFIEKGSGGTRRDCLAGLAAGLGRLDLRLQLQLRKARSGESGVPLARFRGMVVSDEEVDRLVHGPTAAETAEPHDPVLQQELEPYPPLARLSGSLQLTPFEEECLIICLAPELDGKYEKIYGYLHDDLTRRQPSVGLVLDLLCSSWQEQVEARRFFAHGATLLRNRLLRLGECPEGPSTLLSRPLHMDEGIVDLLLGREGIDGRLASVARLSVSGSDPELITLPEETQTRLKEFVAARVAKTGQEAPRLLCHLHGPSGTGRTSLARAICHDLGLPLLIVDLGRLTAERLPVEELLLLSGREAMLRPAGLCLENYDDFIAVDNPRQPLQSLAEMILAFSPLTFVVGTKPWCAQEFFRGHTFVPVEFPIPDDQVRGRFWVAESRRGGEIDAGVDLGELAGKFRFTPLQIRMAMENARNMAHWRSPATGPIGEAELHAACRALSDSNLAKLARKIEPRQGWQDLVLPQRQMEQLQEICHHARFRHIVYGEWGFENKLSYGKGLTALFSGPPGTGKTMGAEVIALALGLDLYRIDLSRVVSKYIGETEKNLDRIFDEARSCNAILFFDEADALFGKRTEVKDAHDRYANIETGYLLQKMEDYDGIAILATNYRDNMDEAFVRRLQYLVEFPLPPLAERRRIWAGIWPESAPRHGDVDLELLAQRFEIAGGSIRNIALAASFKAAAEKKEIRMSHLLHATRREFQKMGKIMEESHFSPSADLP